MALASCGWVWLAGRVATRLAPSWERARGSRFAPVLAAIAGGALGALCGVALAIATHVVSRRTGVVLGVVVGVAIGSAIWIVAGRRASSATLPDPVTTVAARSARRVRVGLAAAGIVPLLVSSAILADHVRAHRGSATGAAQLAAVATVTKWIDANVPSGSTIAFGRTSATR